MMRASRSFSVAYTAATADVRSTEKKSSSTKSNSSSRKRVPTEKSTVQTIDGVVQPMVIPPRTLRPASTDDAKKDTRKRHSSLPTQVKSKKDGISPAVAAVLSSTAIPSRRVGGRRPSVQPFKVLSLTAVAEEIEKEKAVENGRSALNLLLSPPEDDDDLQDPMERLSVTPTSTSMFARKDSNESVPSLDTDNDSLSSISNPSTPRSGIIGRRASLGERRLKQVSSPPKEICLSDHPLQFASVDPQVEIDTMFSTMRPELPVVLDSSTKKRKVSLKSNLTASLRVLKSAAKSFSNFYPPLTHPDDFLTRSILSISPQFTDEKRPVLLDEAPTPALRRYLNPSPAAELKPLRHRATLLGLSPSEDNCTASIQLETYRVSKSAKKAALPTPVVAPKSSSSPTSSPLLTEPAGRQREVRENSNFLRVIVLEMSMRRAGKLTEYAHGKARFVLPPRQVSKKGADDDAGGIPSRWVSLVYDDDESSDSDSASDSSSDTSDADD